MIDATCFRPSSTETHFSMFAFCSSNMSGRLLRVRLCEAESAQSRLGPAMGIQATHWWCNGKKDQPEWMTDGRSVGRSLVRT
jgi:hypothetical protein